MKMFKSSMVWALVALVCVAQDASAGRFIVFGNKFNEFYKVGARPQTEWFKGDVALDTDGSFKVLGEVYGGLGDLLYEWMPLKEGAAPLVVDVDGCDNVTEVPAFLKAKGIGYAPALASRTMPAKWLQGAYDRVAKVQMPVMKKTWQKAIEEAAASGDKDFLKVVAVVVEPADVPAPVDVPKPADDKDKKDTKLNSFQDRFMSYHAGYRYAGANVAILVVASMLQAMQDGYRGVGIEAKDVTEQLSVKTKAVRALAAVVSLKKHASNVSALYRVVRPVSEKGVVSPKFLARATQFAKNKPFIAAGLLGVTALNTYGVYSHAGDIKAYAQSFSKTKTA